LGSDDGNAQLAALPMKMNRYDDSHAHDGQEWKI